MRPIDLFFCVLIACVIAVLVFRVVYLLQMGL